MDILQKYFNVDDPRVFLLTLSVIIAFLALVTGIFIARRRSRRTENHSVGEQKQDIGEKAAGYQAGRDININQPRVEGVDQKQERESWQRTFKTLRAQVENNRGLIKNKLSGKQELIPFQISYFEEVEKILGSLPDHEDFYNNFNEVYNLLRDVNSRLQTYDLQELEEALKNFMTVIDRVRNIIKLELENSLI